MLETQRNFASRFGVTQLQLESMVEKYKERTYNEDLECMEELGGTSGLVQKLGTTLENGLSGDANDAKQREDAFGTNFKAPQ